MSQNEFCETGVSFWIVWLKYMVGITYREIWVEVVPTHPPWGGGVIVGKSQTIDWQMECENGNGFYWLTGLICMSNNCAEYVGIDLHVRVVLA